MRTEDTLERICNQITMNCGDRLQACQTVGVSLQFLDLWCKDDPKVAERVQEAERFGVQGLYSAAVQRAVRGVEEDVYYKGDVVGQKIVYSDSLLTTLLKGKLADFKKEDQTAATNVQVNVAIMPRANNYDEWLQMKAKTIAPAIEAPKNEPIDAEYREVQEGDKLPNLL